MKVLSGLKNLYQIDPSIRNIEQVPGREGQGNNTFRSIGIGTDDPGVVNPVKDILSDQEQSTLHLLFGTEKPAEMNFYNRNQVFQINKGQLLDVRG